MAIRFSQRPRSQSPIICVGTFLAMYAMEEERSAAGKRGALRAACWHRRAGGRGGACCHRCGRHPETGGGSEGLAQELLAGSHRRVASERLFQFCEPLLEGVDATVIPVDSAAADSSRAHPTTRYSGIGPSSRRQI